MTEKENKTNQSNDIDLEELIQQTEQKITNNEYYEDVTVHYRDMNVHVRIKPISQARFTKITEKVNKKSNKMEMNTLLLHECIVNKYDNSQFTVEQIDKLFTGGLASVLALKCAEVSGISSAASEYKEMKDF